MAACLESGLAMSAALTAAGTVATRGTDPSDLPPPGGPGQSPGGRGGHPAVVLDAVAAMLALGAAADTAWRPADADPRLADLAGAARRSADGGSALARAVREHVTALRGESAAADRRAAGRSGVVITAPLGLCFLPAFLCLGLAPVVLGLFGGLHLF
nr:type II secretion system F family protein [Nakamurella flavida]